MDGNFFFDNIQPETVKRDPKTGRQRHESGSCDLIEYLEPAVIHRCIVKGFQPAARTIRSITRKQAQESAALRKKIFSNWSGEL